jgi:excisionase family DNA binding protein
MEELISVAKAASILGVSQRTIRRWCSSGLLRYKRVGKNTRLSKASVMEMKSEYDRGFSSENLRTEVAALRYELIRVKSHLNFLLIKNQLRPINFTFSDADLMSLYAVSEEPPQRVPNLKHVRDWMEAILCLTETEYSRIEALTGDVYPWRRFFSYAEKMLEKIRKKRNFSTNLELQQAAQNMALTQQEIRNCGLVLLTAEPTKMPAVKRFDILSNTYEDSGEIDPEEIIKDMKDDGRPTKKHLKLLKNLQGGSKEYLKGLPSGKK